LQQSVCLLLHCCQLLITSLEQQLPNAFALTNDVLQLLIMLLLHVLVVQGWWQGQARYTQSTEWLIRGRQGSGWVGWMG
jgi:hypothetical protein